MPDSEPARYLVDTNVLSASAPGKAAHDRLAHWMHANSDALHLSVVTLAEVEVRIAKAKRVGATRKARELAEWLEMVVHLYRDKVIPIDAAIARAAGRLLDAVRGQGREPGLADMLIAGTAQVHDLTVLTRNVKDFAGCEVSVLDPFEAG